MRTGSKSDRLDDARCWQAVVARDGSQDDSFVYSVATTGVYCRPSCPSRLARRENVRFHASARKAEAAGFRPCKRCRPDAPSIGSRHADLVAEACRLIESADAEPSLAELAARAGLGPHHFQRVFKAVAGLTPKAYAAAHRARRVRDALPTSRTVTEAIHDAGFGAASRFYAASADALGMTPSQVRAGGRDAEMRFAVGQSSLGAILVAASARGVTAILMGDDPEALVRDLEDRFPAARIVGADRDFERLVAEVVGLVEAPAIACKLPLDIRGTAFQARVWQALRDIPAGTTTTYAELACRIGAPAAVRAVAGACAANKHAVAIPCHRVVRADGNLSGYRWGVERKRALLDREAAGRDAIKPKPKR